MMTPNFPRMGAKPRLPQRLRGACLTGWRGRLSESLGLPAAEVVQVDQLERDSRLECSTQDNVLMMVNSDG